MSTDNYNDTPENWQDNIPVEPKLFKRITIDIDFDGYFFAIIPAINLNFHGGLTLEFEWTFIGIYLSIHKRR